MANFLIQVLIQWLLQSLLAVSQWKYFPSGALTWDGGESIAICSNRGKLFPLICIPICTIYRGGPCCGSLRVGACQGGIKLEPGNLAEQNAWLNSGLGTLCLSLWVIWELCRLACQGEWRQLFASLDKEVFLCHYNILICTCIPLCRLLNFYSFQYGPTELTAGLTIISPVGEEQCGFCNSQVKSPLQELLGSQCFIGVWQKLPDNKLWDPASTQRFHLPKDMELTFLFLSPLVSCYVVSALIQPRKLFWDPLNQCLHLSRATESFNSNRKIWQG